MPPINPQIRARHEAARITEQENGRATILLGVAQSLEHIRIGPSSSALGKRFEEAGCHGGHDVAWRKRVDADAVLAPFGGEVAAELEDSGFGGVIGAFAEVSWESYGKAGGDRVVGGVQVRKKYGRRGGE